MVRKPKSGGKAPPLPLDERVHTAGQLAVRAKIFLDVFWLYENADERPALESALDEYGEFLRFDQHAHLVSFVLYISSLYDTDHRSISLPLLANEALTRTDRRSLKAQFAKASPLLAKVKILRHNLFAHRSNSISYAAAFTLADVTGDQLRDLCTVTLAIANVLLVARQLPEQIFRDMTVDTARKMLHAASRRKGAGAR